MTEAVPHLGLISAMHEEQAGLIAMMRNHETVSRGMRDYVSGTLWGIRCTCVLSRLGKAAAATTAAMLIERFNVTHVVFTGVAGAVDRSVSVGDVVVADALVQHDMDVTPLFPRFEVPLLGMARFPADALLAGHLSEAVRAYLDHDLQHAISAPERSAFSIRQPRLHRGLIASGDQFIGSQATLDGLKAELPDLLAVEMEGAAVAQVCHEFGVPVGVVRTISDDANEHAPVDFMKFIERVASQYTFHIVRRLCTRV
ncbi:MAG: 5-methylthioadenosine/adenosylhomocysteine nucleosidase [Herminiimonas sp.]|nr:5-methylthioadenosine/adenosylhomocysteine nucleosidase [Herminiimonas sp.]